ncbi:hypothetical protein U9M48_033860, partial [Paspalum notatum var. saurae]
MADDNANGGADQKLQRREQEAKEAEERRLKEQEDKAAEDRHRGNSVGPMPPIEPFSNIQGLQNKKAAGKGQKK